MSVSGRELLIVTYLSARCMPSSNSCSRSHKPVGSRFSAGEREDFFGYLVLFRSGRVPKIFNTAQKNSERNRTINFNVRCLWSINKCVIFLLNLWNPWKATLGGCSYWSEFQWVSELLKHFCKIATDFFFC